MRSLQHDLGKRSPLFFTFNAGGGFGFSPVFSGFNNNPVTAPVTENPSPSPSPTSPAAAPIDNTAAFFTSSVNNPTAYSFYNSGVSLDDSAKSLWAASGAFSIEADGKLFSEGSLNPYTKNNEEGDKIRAEVIKLNAKQQEANAKNIQSLFEMFTKLIQVGAKAFSGSGTAAG
jgi:hypothetical protein